MGARYYDPTRGRFTQLDPVGGGSCNYYDYACGDPINRSDLGGTSSKKQPPLPPELEGQCNPLLNTNYDELSSDMCNAYRYAQRTGNHLDDFYRQGFNSLASPVDVTQHRAKYFTCPGLLKTAASTAGVGDYARLGSQPDPFYTANRTTAIALATGGPRLANWYGTAAATAVDAVCTHFGN